MLYRTLIGYVNFWIELEHRLIRTIEMEIEIRPNSGKKKAVTMIGKKFNELSQAPKVIRG